MGLTGDVVAGLPDEKGSPKTVNILSASFFFFRFED